MADAKKLIELILSDEKLKNSKSFQSRIYSDEPIIKTASRMSNYTPPEISMLQKEVHSSRAYYNSVESEFFRQARMMERYEDDYEYSGVFSCYYPTYRDMNTAQMRGYFSWRTKVRKGIVEKTSLSFAFVYIYELLHLIGAGSAEKGFEALVSFCDAYSEHDPKIRVYIKPWLRDFVVYYNLDKSYLKKISDDDFDDALMILENYGSHSDDEIFDAVKSVSSYKIENSRFFKQYPDDVRAVVCGMYRAMSEYCLKHRKKTFTESLFGQKISNTCKMFNSAVFYDYRKYEDYEYTVSGICRYKCTDGRWFCEQYYGSRGKNRRLGDILRTVDSLMREKYDFGHSVNKGAETNYLINIIVREIDKLRELKKKEAALKIEIDVSKLQGIRTASDITRDRLIVDEADVYEEWEETAVTESAVIETAPAEAENDTPLDDGEYEFLHCLLYGGDIDAAARKHGRMLSVLADSVNEKLFDVFGDTVIEFDGDAPVLIEDYSDDLKGIVKE